MDNIIEIGENIPTPYGIIPALFISSTGTLIIFGYTPTLDNEIRSWSPEILDDICSAYYYNKLGQAYLIIDVMVEKGYLSYYNKSSFYNSISQHISEFPNSLQMVGVIGDGKF